MNNTLKELLDTDFKINEEGKLIGYFTLKRINEIEKLIENLYEENKQLKKELKQEKEFSKDSYHKFEVMYHRINEVIEYIKELCTDPDETIVHYGDDIDPNFIINILKGENNNE